MGETGSVKVDELLDFLRRLEAERLAHRVVSRPACKSLRVEVEAGDEIWHVDFCGDEVMGTVFRAVEQVEPAQCQPALERLFGRLARAWREAAIDLGIEFRAPFEFTGKDGQRYGCAGFLPHFGGPHGTVIISRADEDDVGEAADAMGFYTSGLNPFHYERYSRATFVETLQDWGWFGPPELRPAWFSPTNLSRP